MATGAEILAIGMVSAVGMTAPQTAASVRAGLVGARGTAILGRNLEPLTMAVLPDDSLPPLAPALADAPGLTQRQTRMLRLAGVALKECVQSEPRPDRLPVLLAVPEAHPGRPVPVGSRLLEQLRGQAEIPFDLQNSILYPRGRAAGMIALKAALDRLRSGASRYVVIGGVDSYLDLGLLGVLDPENRLLRSGPSDGFLPGEGAAFLLLGSTAEAQRSGRARLAHLEAAADAEEPGHRYSEMVYRGDGLDAAVRGLFAAVPAARAQVRTVYAGFNGENFNAKEWGVAYLRHQERFADDLRVEHPVDCLGDVGAALGPMMVGLAAIGISRGYRAPPCLVWCSSDKVTRGAALIDQARA
ncbi:beta-ketoacyl synthase N-terminal-like domain-containing protein [Sorangium sp. So ce1182]|uniref:beta-ketoacyl synthase N-terminal-like domain-containing protein n=1 Tax=Sorangium sp. So ce1182 TaxID=3133334 RepID=UPI003F6174A9